MSKQIIEAISKAFNRGLGVGKDTNCINPYFIKKALKEEIEDALRKLSTSKQGAEDGQAHITFCTCRTGVFKYGRCVNCSGAKPA